MALNEDLCTVADGAGGEGQSGREQSVCKASHVEARFSSAALPVTLPDPRRLVLGSGWREQRRNCVCFHQTWFSC